MSSIDITLSPNPHNTSCAFTVQPPFSDVHQLLVGSSEFQRRPDQILLNSCMIIATYRAKENDRNIRYDYKLLYRSGDIVHCHGNSRPSADIYQRPCHPFHDAKVPIKPGNQLLSDHSTHIGCGRTGSPPRPVAFKPCLGSASCLPQRISYGPQTGTAGSHPAQGTYILYRRSITNKSSNPTSKTDRAYQPTLRYNKPDNIPFLS